ncbi:YveK family protein [Blastococcus sp. KM273129]|uniref:YveK family protein n=1 Tax=Blastococcus sp. KM273129 TaxID=2570315 RepID=UPI001F026889|nr:Wzz/FepE/Etk N-terminal domain-containing protein [Blastococcus sp. KM273129]MCF6736929.1 hypothetical protein [Blastococcus sp. KM273129]
MTTIREPAASEVPLNDHPTDHGHGPARSGSPSHASSGDATLRDVLQIIRRNWLIVVAALTAALVGGWAITQVTPPTYETQAAVLVSPAVSGDAVTMAQASSFVSNQVATYAALAETPAVLDPALELSGAGLASTEVVDAVTSELVPQTSIIRVTVEGSSGQEAAELANAIATTLIDQIEQQTPADGAVQVSGSVVESPIVPTTPVSPILLVNLAIALTIGLLVAFVTIVFRQALAAGPSRSR